MPVVKLLASSVVALVLVVTFGTIAHAGGAVFDLHNGHYHWGERIVTTTTFSDDVKGRAAVADGPWFAYLRTKVVEPPKIPRGAIELGAVSIKQLDRHFFRARLEFAVPRVAPGSYSVQLCNDPCTDELGDIVGAWVEIARTSSEAVILSRIEKTKNQLVTLVDRSRRDLRRHVRSSTVSLRRAFKTDLAAMAEDVRRLSRHHRLDAARSDGAPPWPLLVAGFAWGALVAWPLARRGVGSRPGPTRDVRAETLS